MKQLVTPLWWKGTIGVGSQGRDVATVQRYFGFVTTTVYDDALAYAVRGLQLRNTIPGTGEVDNLTAALIGPRAVDAMTPEWWTAPLYPGERGYSLVAQDENWIRRVQGNNGLTPTGVIDEATALILGAME